MNHEGLQGGFELQGLPAAGTDQAYVQPCLPMPPTNTNELAYGFVVAQEAKELAVERVHTHPEL